MEENYESANTVSASHQLADDENVFFLKGKNAPGRRILFVGNSITLHSPCPEIGWHGEWGMAASDPAHDYVHLVLSALGRKGLVSGAIAHVADWERNYWSEGLLHNACQEAVDWRPQLVIVRVGENIQTEAMAAHPLQPCFEAMVRFFAGDHAKVVVTDVFWPNAEKERIIADVARTLHAPLVRLADLGAQDGMKAIGRFEHGGVAAHPGDAGMAAIATRILAAIQDCC